jgi:hypothetical protein
MRWLRSCHCSSVRPGSSELDSSLGFFGCWNKGHAIWPPLIDGTMTLTPAQLALLVEAMDWRRTAAPPAPPRPMLV